MTTPAGDDNLALREAMADLARLMATLRTACPWDRVQTHASLRRHLLEETHEVLEVLDRIADEHADDQSALTARRSRDLAEELGDLLFQVVFHAHLAAEEGWFDLTDVAVGVHDKLVARHPKIFPVEGPAAGASVESSASELGWERAKVVEKGRSSVMDGIPRTLPALAYASKVVAKAGAMDPALPTRSPALDDDPERRLGQQLLDVVRQARVDGLDAESALRRAARELESDVRSHESTSAD